MSLNIQQPRPYDLVSDTVLVAGVAGGAFEAHFAYEVGEGHDEVTGSFLAGDGGGGHGQFQIQVDVSGASFTRSLGFVRVFTTSARDGSVVDEVVVPVVFGSEIVPGYTVYDEYVVKSGDTLSAIAAARLGSASAFPKLVEANPHTITNPDLIHPGDVIRIPR
jgi:nucleoid-associated protein YgaU